jgi:hypothetical protein
LAVAAETAEPLFVWIRVDSVDAVRIIERGSRLLERNFMLVEVARRLVVIPLELIVPQGRPTPPPPAIFISNPPENT